MTVLSRAIFKEAALTSAAIAFVLFVLIFFIGFSQAIGKVAVGKSTSDILLQLLALRMLGMSDLILSLSLFLGVLFTMSRWYQDSEMTVLSACGVSVLQLLRPIALLALMFALMEAVASFYLAPYSERHSARIQQLSKERLSLAGVRPGAFSEQGSGHNVLYAERINDQGQLENIFISSGRPGKPADQKRAVIVAAYGQELTDASTGQEYLQLIDGKSYEGSPGLTDFRIIKFGSYKLRLHSAATTSFYSRTKAMTSSALWASDQILLKAEWQWRLARPIATIIVAFIALALAYSEPRRSRLGNLFVAVLIFFVYVNLLSVGTGMLARGVVPLVLGHWLIHAGFAGLTAYMLWRRASNRPILKLTWRKAS